MNPVFGILTIVFIIISAAMILIILVQRPTGGGLAGAFGGAGGGGTDTVFGGRVGDALTVITVIGFVLWLGLAVSLNLVQTESTAQPAAATAEVGDATDGTGTAAPVQNVPVDADLQPTQPPVESPVDDIVDELTDEDADEQGDDETGDTSETDEDEQQQPE